MILSVARLIALVESQGLGHVREWSIIDQGTDEEAYLVNGEFLLRIARGMRSPPRFAKEVTVLRRLEGTMDVAVAQVVAHALAEHEDGPIEYLLLKQPPGVPAIKVWEELSDNERRRVSIWTGRMLGILHRIAWSGYGGYHDQTGSLGPATDWRDYLFDKVASSIADLWRGGVMPRPLLEGCETFLARAEVPRRPLPVLIHGDYGLHNVVLERGPMGWRLGGVNGFGTALAGDAEYEFASGLLVEPDEVNPLSEPFLDGYRSARNLAPGWEQRCAPYRLIYHLALCAIISREYRGDPAMLAYHRTQLIEILKSD